MGRTLVALVACALAGNAQDEAPEPSSELVFAPLPSPTDADAAMPSLVTGADGEVYLSWTERKEEGDETRATLRFARLEGESWGKARTIAEGTDWFVNWADFPSMAALEDGTLVTHFLQRTGDATYAYGVRFILSRDGGETWSEPKWLHEDRSPTEHGFVSFAPLDAERFVAVWLDGRNTVGESGTMALYFRTIGRDGALGPEQELDGMVCDCCQTDVLGKVPGGNGTFVTAYRDRTAGEIRDIRTLGVDTKEQPPRVETHNFPADGWSITGCPVNGPQLARHGSLWAAAWYTGARDASVFVAFAGGGTLPTFPQKPSFGLPIDVDDGLPEGRVDTTFLRDGSLLVSWMEHAEEVEWRVRRIERRPDGSVKPSDSLAVTPVSSDRSSGSLRMAADERGAVLAWTVPGPPDRIETARLTLAD